jgi:hypothetical protein
MQLLTITAATPSIDDLCLSQGGLVDRQTAAADCDVLWTDTAPTQPLLPHVASAPCPVCASRHGAR